MKVFLWKIIIGWATLIDAICLILTFGCWYPKLQLETAKNLAKARMKIRYVKYTDM